jgi:carboxyl-terminal processing protease
MPPEPAPDEAGCVRPSVHVQGLLALRTLFRPLLVTALAAGCSSGPTTPSAVDPNVYLGAMVDVMQASSINRQTINWTSFRSQVLAAGASATTVPQMYPAIQLALGLLGDHHSFYETSSGFIVNNPSAPNCQAPAFTEPAPVPPGIGYVYAGTCFTGCVAQTYATQIQSQIRAIDSTGPLIGWVVDLRSNTGGDFIPMVAGLGPILGDGIAGYFVFPAGGSALSWSYSQGQMDEGANTLLSVAQPYSLTTPNPAVAVLLDNLTASSGEATLVSFLGRPNTRTFGVSSCGLSTSNSQHILSDGAMLYLTDAVDADRTMKTYGGPIAPDEMVSDPGQVVSAATSWLMSSASARRAR